VRLSYGCFLLLALYGPISCSPDPSGKHSSVLEASVLRLLGKNGFAEDRMMSTQMSPVDSSLTFSFISDQEGVGRLIDAFALKPYDDDSGRYLEATARTDPAWWRRDSLWIAGSQDSLRLESILLTYGRTEAWVELRVVPAIDSPRLRARMLLLALSKGDTTAAKAILDRGIDLSLRMPGSHTLGTAALNWAYQRCGMPMVHEILRAGASPCDCDDTGESVLMHAAEAGDHGAVSTFLQQCSTGTNRCLGAAALYAAWGGHIEILDLFLAHGMDIDLLVPTYGAAGVAFETLEPDAGTCPRTLLMAAAESGQEDCVAYLVTRGAQIDVEVGCAGKLGAVSRHSALSLAKENGHDDVVRLLTDAGTPAH